MIEVLVLGLLSASAVVVGLGVAAVVLVAWFSGGEPVIRFPESGLDVSTMSGDTIVAPGSRITPRSSLGTNRRGTLDKGERWERYEVVDWGGQTMEEGWMKVRDGPVQRVRTRPP